MTRALLIPLVLSFGLAAPAAVQAQDIDSFAVVDVQRVMEGTAHWKAAVDKLEKERTGRQAALEAKQKALRDRKEKLDARKAVSDPSALVEEEEALFRDAQVLTQEFMQNQQELSQLEKQTTGEMLSRIEALVRELSVQGDYAFVFEMGTKDEPNVLYVNPKADITDEVVKLYAKHFKDKPLNLK